MKILILSIVVFSFFGNPLSFAGDFSSLKKLGGKVLKIEANSEQKPMKLIGSRDRSEFCFSFKSHRKMPNDSKASRSYREHPICFSEKTISKTEREDFEDQRERFLSYVESMEMMDDLGSKEHTLTEIYKSVPEFKNNGDIRSVNQYMSENFPEFVREANENKVKLKRLERLKPECVGAQNSGTSKSRFKKGAY